ncbi:MAG: VWA domain-containing protein [Nibricoccus sp.]
MTFHWPHAFWLLLLPLAFAMGELRRRRAIASATHPKILRAEAGPSELSLKPDTTGKITGRLRWRLWLGLSLAVVALARPQWGKLEEAVYEESREIIIALDLSRSMRADDVRPSRLDRSKLLITSLLEQLRGERVGLVVFSGTAFLQSPLSADYEILRDFLPGLNPAYLPQGGSNYTALLQTSLTAFGSSGSADRFLIVLSDGEATDDDWKSHVAELKEKGIRVIGLGVGTAAGAMIPDGSGGFVKDERGAVVLSKLENATLQQLATETNGRYADASSWVDLAQLIQTTIDTGKKGTFAERNRARLVERFQWVLAPAIWLLLWSFWWEFPVRPRLRDVRIAQRPEIPNAKPQISNLAIILLLLSLSVLQPFSLSPVHAADKEPPKGPPPADTLTKLVASLSQRKDLTARDYAELANSTIAYGKDLQTGQKHISPGPVNDALAGVGLGEALDTKAADWPKLRSELEALLKKKEPPKQDEKQQSQQQEQKQDKKDQQQQQQKKQEPQNSQQQKQQQKQSQQGQPPPPKQSAFGDMKEKSAEKSNQPQPPADPTEQQKVGGAQEKKEGQAVQDTALAAPLQKLEQLKDQDSPAQLYQLMQGPVTAPKKPAKDW